MGSLVILLTVHGHPVLDQDTRVLLRNNEAFRVLQPDQAEQAWGGTVSSQVRFTVQTQESAIFITEDWVATIRARRLIDCVGGMCAVINALRQEFGTPIVVELSDSHYSSGSSFHLQLDRERTMRRCRTFGIWLFTIVISGLAGALIQWIFGGGS